MDHSLSTDVHLFDTHLLGVGQRLMMSLLWYRNHNLDQKSPLLPPFDRSQIQYLHLLKKEKEKKKRKKREKKKKGDVSELKTYFDIKKNYLIDLKKDVLIVKHRCPTWFHTV